MIPNQKNQLFRLAAVLYADNNYEVTTNTIQKKIIESILLECGQCECTLHHIIDYAQNNYNITLEEEHIKTIVTHTKQTGFLVTYKNDNCYIAIDQKRKLTLEQKISDKTIEYFIVQFEDENPSFSKHSNVKEVIYKFLYELFSTNTASFTKLINKDKNVTSLYEQINSPYTNNEKEIVNAFLHWDNSEKNKAIFNISSYSLEYCMLTNNNGASSIHLQNLRNKTFYLDTNVIYRALGINGEDRKKRSLTFLQKFNDSKEQLVISRITEQEFKEGIKSKIRQINGYNSPRIKSEAIKHIDTNSDVHSFYHQWRLGKVNNSLDLFEAYILSEYEQFKSNLKITLEYNTPYSNDDKETKETIRNYASSIQTFKDNSKAPSIGSSFTDAENIVWLETKRNGNVSNIFDTKYFFISTDQYLRRWDYNRSSNTPLVLLPSQWMSILLRYHDCTDNDYKSFVSFLNLKNNEKLIDGNKLQIVLAGISEITESIEQQRYMINSLINKKFAGIINKNSTDEEIFNNSKEYAESELEKQVKDFGRENRKLSDKHRKLSSQFDSHKKDVKDQIEELQKEKGQATSKSQAIEEENIQLKQKLINKEVKEAFVKWQRGTIPWSIAAFIIIVYILLFFIESDWSYNVSSKLCNWKNSLTDDFVKTIATGLMYSPLIGLWLIIQNVIWKRLFNKEKKQSKCKEISEEIES